MKVLFDTNVLISRLGRRTDTDSSLFSRAKHTINKCDKLNWTKCISERTLREFEVGWNSGNISKDKIKKEKSLIEKFTVLGYHAGNEKWEDIDGHWENIRSLWNNEEESKIADKIKAQLKEDEHRHDRGLLLDAIQNNCEIVISEDLSDFKKIYEVGKKYGVTICTPEKFDDIIILQKC